MENVFLYLIGFVSFCTTVVFGSISQDLTATYTDQPIELDGVLKEAFGRRPTQSPT